MLNIKPILMVKPSGDAFISERVRTRKKALERIVELVQEQGPLERLAVMHGADEEGAQELLGMLRGLDVAQPVGCGAYWGCAGHACGAGGGGVFVA